MPKNSKPLIIVVTGGTGGHVFPAQALSEEMISRGWRVKVWIDKRVESLASNFPLELSVEIIPSKPFAQRSLLARLVVPVILFWGLLIVLWKIIRDRPVRMIGFGSYATFSPLLGGTILGVPSVIHEQNGNMGVVNRIFSKRVNLVASGSSAPNFPPKTKWFFTGNPLRKEVLSKLGRSYNFPLEKKIALLIFGGSQGAGIFDHIIPEAISGLPEVLQKRIKIYQQVRAENIPIVDKKYKNLNIDYEIKPFFENIPELMAGSQLIISRTGASSLAEITAMGLPAILVPFAAAANDHQTINSQVLEEAGAAIILKEKNLNPTKMRDAIGKILLNPEQASQMAAASKQLGVSDAEVRLADLVENLGIGEEP